MTCQKSLRKFCKLKLKSVCIFPALWMPAAVGPKTWERPVLPVHILWLRLPRATTGRGLGRTPVTLIPRCVALRVFIEASPAFPLPFVMVLPWYARNENSTVTDIRLPSCNRGAEIAASEMQARGSGFDFESRLRN